MKRIEEILKQKQRVSQLRLPAGSPEPAHGLSVLQLSPRADPESQLPASLDGLSQPRDFRGSRRAVGWGQQKFAVPGIGTYRPKFEELLP